MQAVSPASEMRSLTQIAVTEGFEKNVTLSGVYSLASTQGGLRLLLYITLFSLIPQHLDE